MIAQQGHMNECRLLKKYKERRVVFCVKQLRGCVELQHETRDIFSICLDDQKILLSESWF